jgi:hypothetical protein
MPCLLPTEPVCTSRSDASGRKSVQRLAVRRAA